MLYWQVMNTDEGYLRWLNRVATWRDRMADIGLDGLLPALAGVARPLGPLTAQLLWVTQPTLGALDRGISREIGSLAEMLHDPTAFDHLLARLAEDAPETG